MSRNSRRYAVLERGAYLESAKRNGKAAILQNCQTANAKSLISTPTQEKLAEMIKQKKAEIAAEKERLKARQTA